MTQKPICLIPIGFFIDIVGIMIYLLLYTLPLLFFPYTYLAYCVINNENYSEAAFDIAMFAFAILLITNKLIDVYFVDINKECAKKYGAENWTSFASKGGALVFSGSMFYRAGPSVGVFWSLIMGIIDAIAWSYSSILGIIAGILSLVVIFWHHKHLKKLVTAYKNRPSCPERYIFEEKRRRLAEKSIVRVSKNDPSKILNGREIIVKAMKKIKR